MRFDIAQRVAVPVDVVVAAYTDPAFYATLEGLPKISSPELLTRDVDGDVVHLRIRYRFTGDLSAAVRAVVDPRKLSWVEDATHDTARHAVRFRMEPDHYADRFTCRGSYRFEADGPAATVRRGSGDLTVRVPLVGRRAEEAIVAGLEEHLAAEGPLVERWAARDGG